jgi:hypothetical protein
VRDAAINSTVVRDTVVGQRRLVVWTIAVLSELLKRAGQRAEAASYGTDFELQAQSGLQLPLNQRPLRRVTVECGRCALWKWARC